jgi:hypothetical protein
VFREICTHGSSKGQLRAIKHLHLRDKGLRVQACVRELENLATFSEDKVSFRIWPAPATTTD